MRSGVLSQIIVDHRAWLEERGDLLLERNLDRLRARLEDGSREAFRVIPASLDGISHYYAARGSVRLVDSDPAGWQDLATAIDFAAWEVEVRAASFFSSLTKEASDLTLDVNSAASIACVSPKWEARMLQVLRNVDADPSSINQGFWTSRRFEPFVVRLLDTASGRAPIESALEAPYDAVLDRWNGDGLGEALEAVCDDHVEQVEQSRLGDDRRASFDRSPFDLLPVEVMLVRRVRASLGLETPDVDHRLTSIFGSGGAVPGESEHSIFGTLEYAFRRCFG